VFSVQIFPARQAELAGDRPSHQFQQMMVFSSSSKGDKAVAGGDKQSKIERFFSFKRNKRRGCGLQGDACASEMRRGTVEKKEFLTTDGNGLHGWERVGGRPELKVEMGHRTLLMTWALPLASEPRKPQVAVRKAALSWLLSSKSTPLPYEQPSPERPRLPPNDVRPNMLLVSNA
jgi:hypothetical protein